MSAGTGKGRHRAELRPDKFSIPAQPFPRGAWRHGGSRRTKRWWEVFLRSCRSGAGSSASFDQSDQNFTANP